MNRFRTLSTFVGTIASVLALIIPILVSYESISTWMKLGLVVFALLTLLTLVVFFRSAPTIKVYKREDFVGIRNYMFRWIKNGGRVAIWTRDMSWVSDKEMTNMLVGKAKAGELIVCLPEGNDLSDSLRLEGAEVIAYGVVNTPSSSFTIVNYERDGSRVAVGRPDGNLHIIQEFSVSDSPILQLTNELVRLVRQKNYAE